MVASLEKYLADISNIETGYDAFRSLRKIAADYGMESFSFMGLSGQTHQLCETLVVNNWNPGLVQAYDEYKLAERSCVWEKLRHSTVPFYWDIETLSQVRPKDEAKITNELFSDYDMTKGIFLPVHRCHSEPLAICFTFNEGRPELSQLAELQFLASHAGAVLHPKVIAKGKATPCLSPREKECLKWTSDGKTSSEIGKILSLSEHTVNHHLYGGMQKLDATNRIHAVAIAVRSGLLN
ncbi:MAG: LuxR C-terminal-related transcriptional regulator [Hyphomicrobiales bacterium]